MTQADTIWIAMGCSMVAGWVSAVISRVRYERRMRAERLRVIRILMDEYRYWADQDEPVDNDVAAAGIHMGAIGSISNVMAAVQGHPAPWHAAAPDVAARVQCPGRSTSAR